MNLDLGDYDDDCDSVDDFVAESYDESVERFERPPSFASRGPDGRSSAARALRADSSSSSDSSSDSDDRVQVVARDDDDDDDAYAGIDLSFATPPRVVRKPYAAAFTSVASSDPRDEATRVVVPVVDHGVEPRGSRDDDARGRPTEDDDDAEAERDAEIRRTAASMCTAAPSEDSSVTVRNAYDPSRDDESDDDDASVDVVSNNRGHAAFPSTPPKKPKGLNNREPLVTPPRPIRKTMPGWGQESVVVPVVSDRWNRFEADEKRLAENAREHTTAAVCDALERFESDAHKIDLSHGGVGYDVDDDDSSSSKDDDDASSCERPFVTENSRVARRSSSPILMPSFLRGRKMGDRSSSQKGGYQSLIDSASSPPRTPSPPTRGDKPWQTKKARDDDDDDVRGRGNPPGWSSVAPDATSARDEPTRASRLDEDAGVVDDAAPTGALTRTLDPRDDAETAMMVSPASSYETPLFGRDEEEENDDDDEERGEGRLVADVRANERPDGRSSSEAPGLFSIDNDDDDGGANEEAYRIAKNLLYGIDSDDEELMGPREKPPSVWSKRYASTKMSIYDKIRLPSGSYSSGEDDEPREKTTKQRKGLFSSVTNIFSRSSAKIADGDACSNQDKVIHLHNHDRVSHYNKKSERKRATFRDRFMGIKFTDVRLSPIETEGKEFRPEDNAEDLMMTEHERIRRKRCAGLCMFFVCIATVTCIVGVFWRAERGSIFFSPKNKHIEGLVRSSTGFNNSDSISFYAISDAPRSKNDESILTQQLIGLSSDVSFGIHLGGIQEVTCDSGIYSNIQQILELSPVHFLAVPSDGDWSSCPNPDDSLRAWRGTLGTLAPSTSTFNNVTFVRQVGRSENFALLDRDVLFLGINMIGQYHRRDEGQEQAGQDKDDWEWTRQNLDLYQPRAVVIFGHAAPGFSQYECFFQFLKKYDKLPTLYVHGNAESKTNDGTSHTLTSYPQFYVPFEDVGLNLKALAVAPPGSSEPLRITVNNAEEENLHETFMIDEIV